MKRSLFNTSWRNGQICKLIHYLPCIVIVSARVDRSFTICSWHCQTCTYLFRLCFVHAVLLIHCYYYYHIYEVSSSRAHKISRLIFNGQENCIKRTTLCVGSPTPTRFILCFVSFGCKWCTYLWWWQNSSVNKQVITAHVIYLSADLKPRTFLRTFLIGLHVNSLIDIEVTVVATIELCVCLFSSM